MEGNSDELPPPAPRRRKRWLLIVAALAVVGASVAGFWAFWKATAWRRAPVVALAALPDDRAVVLRIDDHTRQWQLSMLDGTGDVVWSSVLDPATLHAPFEHGLGRAEILVDPQLGIGTLGTSYGFSLENGAELWRYDGAQRSPNPVVVNFFRQEGVLFALYKKEIVAVDMSNGSERWRVEADLNRRFYRLPGRVVIQTWGAKEAFVHDLSTGAKTVLPGPVCRIGGELLSIRPDGLSVYGEEQAPVRRGALVLTGFERPKCGLRGDNIVIGEATTIGVRLVALDKTTLDKRWELDLRAPASGLASPMAERLVVSDALPQFMPVRAGDTRMIVDLDAGAVARQLDLAAAHALADTEGYVAAHGRLYAVDRGNITRFEPQAAEVAATVFVFAGSTPELSENVVWLFEGEKVGRLHADTLQPLKGSGWVTDPGFWDLRFD